MAAGAASVALGGGLPALAYTRRRQAVHSELPRIERIAVSSWSLHNYFRATRDRSSRLPGATLVLLDFPDAIVDRYSIRHFEFCASHFPSTEPEFLKELKYTLKRTESSLVNLVVDIEQCGPEGTFSSPDWTKRSAALNIVKSWVDVAHELGARSISAGPGKMEAGKWTRTMNSYRTVAAYAQAKGLHVLVENRAGFGVKLAEDLVKLIKLIGPGRISALPDLTGFADESARAEGLKTLFHYASELCHVQSREFNAAGDEKSYDLRAAVEVARRANFRGIYSIQFEGPGDPYTGIQKTLDELLKEI